MRSDDTENAPLTGFADLLRTGVRQATAPEAATHEPEGQAESLGRCRLAGRPQLMLGFRTCDGGAVALPYSHLTRVDAADPDRKIALAFGGDRVAVDGEHLLRLYHLLLEHRVREFVESDRADALAAEPGDAVVTSIRFDKL